MTYPGRVDVVGSLLKRGGQGTNRTGFTEFGKYRCPSRQQPTWMDPCQPAQLDGFSWRFQGRLRRSEPPPRAQMPVIDALRRFRL